MISTVSAGLGARRKSTRLDAMRAFNFDTYGPAATCKNNRSHSGSLDIADTEEDGGFNSFRAQHKVLTSAFTDLTDLRWLSAINRHGPARYGRPHSGTRALYCAWSTLPEPVELARVGEARRAEASPWLPRWRRVAGPRQVVSTG